MNNSGKEDIGATIKFLFRESDTFELCAIGKADRAKLTASGWYKANAPIDPRQLKIYRNIYVTLNPTTAALEGRSYMRLKEGVARTADKDIPILCNMLLDFDPVRPSDTASSDEEHQAALDLAANVKDYLITQEWPEPFFADSGNGAALICPLPELANVPENVGLVKNCIAVLSDMFDTDPVKIDRSVSNPARLVRLYGTPNRKGDSIPERPHRLSGIISVPKNRIPVSIEKLRELAAQAQTKNEDQGHERTSGTGRLDVEKYLAHYGIEIVKTKKNGSATLYCLHECVFDPSHAPNEAAIVQSDSGALAYQCFHNGCKGKTWKDARAVISGLDNLKKFLTDTSERKRVHEVNADKDVTKVTFDYDKNIIPETDFPFNVFNDDFLQLVNILSKAIHIEPEIAAAVMLAIMSGAIGNTVRVSPKKGYTVPLFIWLIIIAFSGYGKSPLMSLLMRHIKSLQSKGYMEYEKKIKGYEKALRDAKNDNTLSIPVIPRLRHFEVADNTVEALTTIFQQDPRGTISNQDEIASLIQGLNQYKGKGNDREQYLSFFNCESIKVDRKGKTIFAPNTGLSIIGGIQPKKMPGIFESDSFDDGFIARFLTINGNENSIEFSREFVTDETIQYWIALIDYCYSILLELDENGFVKFKTLILSEDAIEAYISFYNDFGKKMLFLTERARVFIPKLIAYYCLKFSGILHVLNCYHDNISSDAIPQLIDIEIMTHAIALTKYFAGQVVETVMLYDKKECLNEFQVVLIQALYDLREDVTGGKILLSRIVEVFNSRIPSEMTPHAVSAMLRDFGLITEKKGLNLSYLLWEPNKIQKLFNRKKVTNVTNVTKKDYKQNTNDTFDTFVTFNQENKDTEKVNEVIVDSEDEVLTVMELSS